MISIRSQTRRTFAAAVVLPLMMPVAVAAQTDLPPAKDLVARHVAAIGGADALLSRTSIHMVGEFSMAAMGLTGKVEAFQMHPDKSFSRVSIEGLGEIKRGFDGTTGWSMNPMEGPRLLEGTELQQAKDESDMLGRVRDPSVVSSMETTEKTEMDGQPCYRVKFVWKSGRETTDCFSVDSGLLVGGTVNVVSPMGNVEATVLYSDYKDFGPFKMPTVTRQQLMGQEQAVRITSVEFGKVDPAVFELPPEIQALKKQE
ncbi:MAG: hypothetical protein ACREMQ_05175 [Longimicrobiales bacterium]